MYLNIIGITTDFFLRVVSELLAVFLPLGVLSEGQEEGAWYGRKIEVGQSEVRTG